MPTKKQGGFKWSRMPWTQRGASARFSRDAQNALNDAESKPARPVGNSLYRAGVTLSELEPGQCGTVRRLLGATTGRLRLLEMGLTPGTHVKVLRAASFGGPLDILVRGYQLSVRRDEASSVWLDDEDGSK